MFKKRLNALQNGNKKDILLIWQNIIIDDYNIKSKQMGGVG